MNEIEVLMYVRAAVNQRYRFLQDTFNYTQFVLAFNKTHGYSQNPIFKFHIEYITTLFHYPFIIFKVKISDNLIFINRIWIVCRLRSDKTIPVRIQVDKISRQNYLCLPIIRSLVTTWCKDTPLLFHSTQQVWSCMGSWVLNVEMS